MGWYWYQNICKRKRAYEYNILWHYEHNLCHMCAQSRHSYRWWWMFTCPSFGCVVHSCVQNEAPSLGLVRPCDNVMTCFSCEKVRGTIDLNLKKRNAKRKLNSAASYSPGHNVWTLLEVRKIPPCPLCPTLTGRQRSIQTVSYKMRSILIF